MNEQRNYWQLKKKTIGYNDELGGINNEDKSDRLFILHMINRNYFDFQQLRSLITELTMGYDFMKIRRRNIRAATNTLLLIISAYLISNLLSLFLSISVFLRPGLLQRQYPIEYRLCSDGASLLTLIGNALRFPAHFCSNAEVREQCRTMFCPRRKVGWNGSNNIANWNYAAYSSFFPSFWNKSPIPN